MNSEQEVRCLRCVERGHLTVLTLIKDLNVKGAGETLKRGTLIKSIRLTGDPQEIDCKFEGITGIVLRAEFIRKR